MVVGHTMGSPVIWFCLWFLLFSTFLFLAPNFVSLPPYPVSMPVLVWAAKLSNTESRCAGDIMDNGSELLIKVPIPIGFVIFAYTQIPLGKVWIHFFPTRYELSSKVCITKPLYTPHQKYLVDEHGTTSQLLLFLCS